MNLENFEIYFMLFALANTFFSYRAGKQTGTFNGMLSAFQFLKTKNALKDKNSILDFSKWPRPLQEMYKDPYKIENE